MQNQSPPNDQYQFFDQNRGDAPWLDSQLLPENPYQEQWGNLVDGKVEPHELSTLLAQLKAGPGALQWNGKPENPPIAFVAAPGEKRMVPVAERQEFKDLILDSHEKFYSSKKKKNGLIFLFLFCICLAMAYGGLGGDAFLPAIFAVISGGAYLESWIALKNLRKSPDEYLKTLAATARYAYWQVSGGVRTRFRTYSMVGAWIIIAVIQACVSFDTSPHGSRSGILAVGLIKSLVSQQPWRLLTGPMLHVDLMHIIMNALAMLSLGTIIERSVHRHLVAPIWVLGALFGSLLSWIAFPATSIGASGGIMALFGFLLVTAWRRRPLLPPNFFPSLLRSLLIMVIFGILAWAVIDNAAHFGGLTFGALFGAWVFRSPFGTLPIKNGTWLSIFGLLAEFVFVLVAIATAVILLR